MKRSIQLITAVFVALGYLIGYLAKRGIKRSNPQKPLLLLALFALSGSVYGQTTGIPVPKPHQLKWHEAEVGVVFHYDLHVFDGVRYGQGNNRINPIDDYNIFNPRLLTSSLFCNQILILLNISDLSKILGWFG